MVFSKLAIVGWGSLAAQDDTQNAWALPGTITALERAGAPRQEQMLYTFRHASTVGQVSADLAELRAALPAGTIIGHAVALSSENLATMGNGIHASSTVPSTWATRAPSARIYFAQQRDCVSL